jgi:hypothetical protein
MILSIKLKSAICLQNYKRNHLWSVLTFDFLYVGAKKQNVDKQLACKIFLYHHFNVKVHQQIQATNETVTNHYEY